LCWTSTLVGAALKPDSVPEQTLLRIVRDHQLIVSRRSDGRVPRGP
jgi:hypothetical protein